MHEPTTISIAMTIAISFGVGFFIAMIFERGALSIAIGWCVLWTFFAHFVLGWI